MPNFKDQLDIDLARHLAQAIHAVYPSFEHESFIRHIDDRVDSLEMKDRVALFAAALRDHLPLAYEDALDILLAILPPDHDQDDISGDFRLWPIAHFVEVYGLEDFERSMAAMVQITPHFSAEFAIRPYLERYPQPTLDRLRQWVHHPDHHVRRLCSEGTRPRLPWAAQLKGFIADPSPVIPILDALKNDPSLYVRRSVANHLNDITKDNPKIALDVLRRWHIESSDRIQWITKHALRTMIKAGDVEALTLMGYLPPQVYLVDFTVRPDAISMGQTLTLSCTLESEADEPQDLIIDYVMHFVKANGSAKPKVFKLTKRTLAPGERLRIEKAHTIKPITTRRYYSGDHRIELQINGRRLGEVVFSLRV